MNILFEKNNIKGVAHPVVGQVYLNRGVSINLNQLAKKITPQNLNNFVKDHDFVEVQCDGCIVYIDPCLYDLVGNNCKTFPNMFKSSAK